MKYLTVYMIHDYCVKMTLSHFKQLFFHKLKDNDKKDVN